ncbi:SpoIIE family protein phosphatase [Anaeroarcus burkinensis]|uniref:SpoIIE family protein phosphatase n=1 Tax=Anaeroarcus burkinensis TaxID=82376 RepID=UPI000421FFFF|nr:PAS domain-containing protein [Anaeroarcus burkinensis]
MNHGELSPLQVIFQHMPTLAWMKDREGRFLEVNTAVTRFCHKSPAEILGKTVRDIMPAFLSTVYEALDTAVLQSRMPQSRDHIYRENRAGSNWFDTQIIPIFHRNGSLCGTIGFSRKISRRKQLELKLENQQQFLRTMMDSIPDILVFKDLQCQVLGCNKSCRELLYGVEQEQDVIGKTSWDILKDTQLAENCLKKDYEALLLNQPVKVEEQYTLVNGSVIDVETVKTPYHDKEGYVTGLIAISRDITERKRYEQELRCREQQTLKELHLAAQVQQDTLPDALSLPELRVNTLFLPYHTVSGDLFNYKWFAPEKTLRGYMVDVSGHGVATALQTASLKMLLDTRLLNGESITEDHFELINQRIKQYLHEDAFAGIAYFEFDLQKSLLTFISGGINFYLTANESRCSLIPVSSRFLGIFDDIDMQTVTRPLKAGEVYCIMSDGVSDLMELHGLQAQPGLSGYTRWLETLSQKPERSDDFSAVVLEINQLPGQLRLPCIQTQQDLSRAQTAIHEYVTSCAPEGEAAFLEVAANEALNNGFLAGQRVSLRMRRCGNRLSIRVKDDGPGFDARSLLSKLQNTSPEAWYDELGLHDHGRGIFLMHSACDRLAYNAKGNEVLLLRKFSTPALENKEAETQSNRDPENTKVVL